MTGVVWFAVIALLMVGITYVATRRRRWPWLRQVDYIWRHFDGTPKVQVWVGTYRVDPVVVIALGGQAGYRYDGRSGRGGGQMHFKYVGPLQAIPDGWPQVRPVESPVPLPPVPLTGASSAVVGPTRDGAPSDEAFPGPTTVHGDMRPYPWNQFPA